MYICCTGIREELGNAHEVCWNVVGRSGKTGIGVTGPGKGLWGEKKSYWGLKKIHYHQICIVRDLHLDFSFMVYVLTLEKNY